MSRAKNSSDYLRGMKTGIPIGLGYFAVAFSLGITAKNAGLSAFSATITSLLLNASAGEYAAFTLMAADASYWEIAIMEFIANARYLLMACALSQRLSDKTSLFHRLIMGFAVTDEIFGASIAEPADVNHWYFFGMMTVAMPGWASGTGLGVIVGNILPANIVSALSVGLFGMFLAIVVPAAKKNKIVLGVVIVSMLASCACCYAPLISQLPEGVRLILLTVIISAIAALLFPVKDEESTGKEADK